MLNFSLNFLKKIKDAAYEKAIAPIARAYVLRKMEENPQSIELQGKDARKNALQEEFRETIRLSGHKEALFEAVSLLTVDGKRHLKADEWEMLAEELKLVKESLATLDYSLASPSDGLYKVLGLTDDGLRAIDTIARQKYRFQEFENAVSLHILLVTLHAKNPNFWYHLGLCYQEAKKYDKAISAYENCQSLDKENLSAKFFTCECHLGLKNMKQAKTILAEVLDEIEQKEDKEKWQKLVRYIEQAIEK